MENLIKFYKNICDMLDITVKDDDSLVIVTGEVESPFIINGKQAYLPTKDTIATMVSANAVGDVEVVKELFNPLEETFKGPNKSFEKLKYAMELRLTSAILYIGQYLMTEVANNPDKIEDMFLTKYAALVSKNPSSAKKLVTQKSINDWSKLYDSIRKEGMVTKYVQFKIIKKGTIDGIEYNRVGTIEFPLAELLNEHNVKDGAFKDVKISKNDIFNYMAIFEFIAGDKKKVLDGISKGSLNTVSPSMHLVLSMYSTLQSKLSGVIDVMLEDENVTEDIKTAIKLKPLGIDLENLSSFIDGLSPDLKMIPTEAAVINESVSPVKSNWGNAVTEINNQQSSSGWGNVPVQSNVQPQQQVSPWGNPVTPQVNVRTRAERPTTNGWGAPVTQQSRYANIERPAMVQSRYQQQAPSVGMPSRGRASFNQPTLARSNRPTRRGRF